MTSLRFIVILLLVAIFDLSDAHKHKGKKKKYSDDKLEKAIKLNSRRIDALYSRFGLLDRISEASTMFSCEQYMGKNRAQFSPQYASIISQKGKHLLCDTKTKGGGWVVIQRRIDGSVNFYRTWREYQKGFGSFDSNFWLGLDTLQSLTATGNWQLRVEFEHGGEKYSSEYHQFAVGNETTNYKLYLKGHSGSTVDDLAYHNGMPFTTYDQDNDMYRRHNCATLFKGGWWYNRCALADLNGLWGSHIYWHSVTQFNSSATMTEMKIRRYSQAVL